MNPFRTYYHGGHLGDAIYALYAIKKAGGGRLTIGPHDHSNWTQREMHALKSLVDEQPYISESHIVTVKPRSSYYDFTKTWTDLVPEDHFELSVDRVPGNINLKKRDLINCLRGEMCLVDILNLLDHNEPWLTVPDPGVRGQRYDIVVHAPKHKMTRNCEEYRSILRWLHALGFKIAMIHSRHDENQWSICDTYDIIFPDDLLHSARLIAGARVFMGTASCNYVIAEGINQFRFVDIHQDAEGTVPMNDKGWDTSKWSNERVFKSILKVICRQ